MNKKILAVAIAGAMTVPMAAQAVKYKLSGQVNRAIVFMDDGEQSGVRNVDVGASSSRIRLRGSEDLGNGMKVGFYWENDMRSTKSSAQRPEMNGDGPDSAVGIRQSNVWFSGNWGRLTVGQTAGAGDGMTEAFGSLIAGQYRTSYTGGMNWRTSGGRALTAGGGTTANGGASALTESSTFSAFDMFSRSDLIRYDAPMLGPVQLKASIGNDSQWEVGAFLSTDLGGGSLAINAGYGESSQRGVDNRWGGSTRFTFSQGTSIGGAYAESESTGGGTADTWTVSLGHAWGNNSVLANYSESSDVTTNFDDKAWNFSYGLNLPKANTNLYAGFLYTELDTPAGFLSVEDHTTFVMGARVKFN